MRTAAPFPYPSHYRHNKTMSAACATCQMMQDGTKNVELITHMTVTAGCVTCQTEQAETKTVQREEDGLEIYISIPLVDADISDTREVEMNCYTIRCFMNCADGVSNKRLLRQFLQSFPMIPLPHVTAAESSSNKMELQKVKIVEEKRRKPKMRDLSRCLTIEQQMGKVTNMLDNSSNYIATVRFNRANSEEVEYKFSTELEKMVTAIGFRQFLTSGVYYIIAMGFIIWTIGANYRTRWLFIWVIRNIKDRRRRLTDSLPQHVRGLQTIGFFRLCGQCVVGRTRNIIAIGFITWTSGMIYIATVGLSSASGEEVEMKEEKETTKKDLSLCLPRLTMELQAGKVTNIKTTLELTKWANGNSIEFEKEIKFHPPLVDNDVCNPRGVQQNNIIAIVFIIWTSGMNYIATVGLSSASDEEVEYKHSTKIKTCLLQCLPMLTMEQQMEIVTYQLSLLLVHNAVCNREVEQNYITAMGFSQWTSGVNYTMVLIIWDIDFILNMFEVLRPSVSSGYVDKVRRGVDRDLGNRASSEEMKETEEEKKNNRVMDLQMEVETSPNNSPSPWWMLITVTLGSWEIKIGLVIASISRRQLSSRGLIIWVPDMVVEGIRLPLSQVRMFFTSFPGMRKKFAALCCTRDPHGLWPPFASEINPIECFMPVSSTMSYFRL